MPNITVYDRLRKAGYDLNTPPEKMTTSQIGRQISIINTVGRQELSSTERAVLKTESAALRKALSEK